jgi:hypothetical protein
MMAARQNCPLVCPTQADLDGFRRAGVDVLTLATPIAMKVASGNHAQDGLFEADSGGDNWFAFEELVTDDIVFWDRRTGALTSWSGRAFALGEELIDQAATYSLDCALNIFADPLDWLRARRDGIVVLPECWPLAFDRLRDCPRIAIVEPLLPAYRRWMKPSRLPELAVLRSLRRAAA